MFILTLLSVLGLGTLGVGCLLLALLWATRIFL